jgi:hypothetical protein
VKANEAKGAAKRSGFRFQVCLCSAVNYIVRMSVHACPAPKRAGYRRRVLERWGHSSVQCKRFIVQSTRSVPHSWCGTGDTLCMIWELWA